MKKLILLAMVIGVLVSGCASYTGGSWTKPDYNWEQYKLDKYECIAIATQNWDTTAFFFHSLEEPEHTKRFGYCMEKRGYEWRAR